MAAPNTYHIRRVCIAPDPGQQTHRLTKHIHTITKMATSFQSHVHHNFEPPTSELLFGGRRVSDILRDGDTSVTRRSSRKSSTENSALTEIVHSLANRSSSDILPSKLIGADYETILEWISSERMRKLPAEGSSYDKVLVWARLFVERLHSFDLAVESFAGDNHMAAQLAYVHCASLLSVCLPPSISDEVDTDNI